MRRTIIAAASLTAISLISASSFAQDFLIRKDGESVTALGEMVLPPNFQRAHQVIEGTFGPSAGNLVVLAYQREGDPLTSWVLVPQMSAPNKYLKYQLPRSEAMHGRIAVEAVFFANVDRDPENELLILCSQMTGIGPTGAQPWYETYVYDWDGSGFILREEVRKKLFNLSTSRAVRKKLEMTVGK